MRATLLSLLLLGGCATTLGGGSEAAPTSQFPSRAALDKIAAAPAPAKLTGDPGLAADGWQLAGPLPDAIEPMQYSDGSPWQRMLEEAAARRPGLVALPASMQCVARENGAFYLAKQSLPAERLARWIAARCGALASDVQLYPFDGTLPDGTPIERAAEHIRGRIDELFARVLKGGPQQAGIWFGKKSGRAVLMVSVATRRANVEAMSLIPPADGHVIVRGELLDAADHLEAVYNRGRFGFGRCTVDYTVALPRFAVMCPVDAADASSWIEIAAFPAGRVLGHVVASLVVFPSGTPPTSYHDAGYVTRTVRAGADARDQLFALLNEVRRGAGLPEVALAARQSEVATRVAPHYFAAAIGVEPELVADEVVLGLRAGWEVEGDVLSGDFTAGALARTNDLGQLLDSVLERPSGRLALLAHAARVVALGPIVAPEQHVIALVATSYTLFAGANHAADAQRVLGRLTKARIDAQLAPPRRLTDIEPYAQDGAARVERGELAPKKALQRMLERSADHAPGLPFHGWVFEASALDDVTFPRDLVTYPMAGVAIAVTHYRPRNSPWSRLVVFVVTASTHDTRSVARDAPVL